MQFNQTYNPIHNIKLCIDKIKQSAETKLSGIILDQNLNWKSHIDSVSSHINKFCYTLKQVKNVTDLKTAVTSYRAYIESILR